MLPIPPYPRSRWFFVTAVTGAILSVGIVLGYGIPTGMRMHTVASAQSAAEVAGDSNRFWRMVAGTDAADGSDLGRVAAATRDVSRDQPNALRALMNHYVAPGDLPDLEDRLGYHAFEAPAPENRQGVVTDRGRFTPQYILDAVQALGLVPGSSATDLVKPVPDIPSYGLLRWEYGIAGLAGLWLIAGSILLVLRRDRRRWPKVAHARALSELSDDEREVHRIITGLRREPHSVQRDDLLTQAEVLFHDMRDGLHSRDQLAEFRTALADAGSAWQFKREAYDEITGQ